MHFNLMMYFYFYYLHQYVSTSNPAIFLVMSLIQEHGCSEIRQNQSTIIVNHIISVEMYFYSFTNKCTFY